MGTIHRTRKRKWDSVYWSLGIESLVYIYGVKVRDS